MWNPLVARTISNGAIGSSHVPRLEQGVRTSVPCAEIRKDGSFELTGFTPGRYRPIVGDLPQRGKSGLIPAGDGTLTIPEGRREVVVELVVVRSGMIAFSVLDPRLPPLPYTNVQVAIEKERFGAASRVDVIDATGAVVSSRTTLWANVALYVAVAPGDYTVRLVLCGETPHEQRCTVTAGDTVSVEFPAK